MDWIVAEEISLIKISRQGKCLMFMTFKRC